MYKLIETIYQERQDKSRFGPKQPVFSTRVLRAIHTVIATGLTFAQAKKARGNNRNVSIAPER